MDKSTIQTVPEHGDNKLFSLFRKYKSGTASKKIFCQKQGLPLNKFQYLYRKHHTKLKEIKSNRKGFQPIHILESSSAATNPRVEILYTDGTRVFVSGLNDANWLKSLIPYNKKR